MGHLSDLRPGPPHGGDTAQCGTGGPQASHAVLSLRCLRADAPLGRSRHLAVCGVLAAPLQRRARDILWCWWRDAALHYDGCQGGAPVSPLRGRLAVWPRLAALCGVCETGGGQPMTRPVTSSMRQAEATARSAVSVSNDAGTHPMVTRPPL